MQTRKKNKYRLIGILFVVIGIIVGIIPIFLKSKERKEMNAQIDSFLESPSSPSRTSDVVLSPPIEEEETFLMVLEIPKVNLRRGIYSKDSKWNSIEYNVTILEESNFPDEEYGNVILAAHNGPADIAYFNQLHQLEVGDMAYVYYNGIKYGYEVSDIYDVAKDGTVEISRNKNLNTLTLITCKKNTSDRQLVIILYLTETVRY